ncbi:MAG: helix-turn-helix domain-containing protein [Pseudonocardiales bacterium]|nr:helix-turn-helix domain-containing protein [Pseudonocardiales bacterium]
MDDASERRREIGRRVAQWRVRRGLSRGRFAELCERSLSWVDKVESGERGLLRLPMLERVAEVLHVSVETLADTAEIRQARHCLDLFEVSAIRSALQSYQAISRVFIPSAAEPPDLDRLTQQVTYAWTVYQNAHWPLLGQTLPRLLTTAQAAVAAYPGTDDQARRARTLLSQAYQVTASTLIKLDEFDLAWLAAERGFVLAEETGDSLLIGAAARQVVRSLMFLKHYDQSLELVRVSIDRLEPERDSGSPAYLSLYGMLFLGGSVCAARASKPAVARDLLDEGHSVARQLGYDGNEYFTAFGPTNVHLYRVGVQLRLGDGVGVLSAARQVPPNDLSRLPKERRSSYYLDVAWGHSLAGHPDDAVSALLTTENLFPDVVRCRPFAIDLIDTLRRSASGTRAQELKQLAARAGLKDDD